ncbi:kinase-like domain-containing protein [Melanogaster broomeanus]|nr:kinase-like domain-containing protein [Melanogaster broomeanus]
MESNVLIDGNGRACIADFGLSTLLTALGGSTFSTSCVVKGTLRWVAPELLELMSEYEEDSPQVLPTTRSDVYSFGGIMLQILTGKVPYYYYTREAQVVHALSRGDTPKRPRLAFIVTDRRWRFIQQCWSTVDEGRLRPSGEQLVEFVSRELAEIV